MGLRGLRHPAPRQRMEVRIGGPGELRPATYRLAPTPPARSPAEGRRRMAPRRSAAAACRAAVAVQPAMKALGARPRARAALRIQQRPTRCAASDWPRRNIRPDAEGSRCPRTSDEPGRRADPRRSRARNRSKRSRQPCRPPASVHPHWSQGEYGQGVSQPCARAAPAALMKSQTAREKGGFCSSFHSSIRW